MIVRILLFAALAALSGGCAYRAAPVAAPSYSVVTSCSEKIHGKWLLAVSADALNQSVKSSTYACSFHNFPLELSGVYATSVAETLRNVFDQLEQIPTPIPG